MLTYYKRYSYYHIGTCNYVVVCMKYRETGLLTTVRYTALHIPDQVPNTAFALLIVLKTQ
jgi:hypothetical protein